MRDYHGDGGAAAQRESEEGFEVKRREGPHSNSLAELKRLVLECPGAICLQKSLRGSERENLCENPCGLALIISTRNLRAATGWYEAVNVGE